jgi:hypothetical protein
MPIAAASAQAPATTVRHGVAVPDAAAARVVIGLLSVDVPSTLRPRP